MEGTGTLLVKPVRAEFSGDDEGLVNLVTIPTWAMELKIRLHRKTLVPVIVR